MMAYNTPNTLLDKLYDSFTYSEELNECEMLKSDKQSHVTPNLHDFFCPHLYEETPICKRGQYSSLYKDKIDPGLYI